MRQLCGICHLVAGNSAPKRIPSPLHRMPLGRPGFHNAGPDDAIGPLSRKTLHLGLCLCDHECRG
jgi:hypothetical protein